MAEVWAGRSGKTRAEVDTLFGTYLTAFAAVLTKLDADAGVTSTDYAAKVGALDGRNAFDMARQHNALCDKLDGDVAVDERDYRATCGVDLAAAQAKDLYTSLNLLTERLGGLVAKLNKDKGVTDVNYTA